MREVYSLKELALAQQIQNHYDSFDIEKMVKEVYENLIYLNSMFEISSIRITFENILAERPTRESGQQSKIFHQ